MWTSLGRKYTYKYTKVNKHLKQLFCVSHQFNFTVNAESGLARARKGGNVFYHQREPRSLKRDVKQCLLLKMLAWGSQQQLWWRILTEFALISAVCNSSTQTRVGVTVQRSKPHTRHTCSWNTELLVQSSGDVLSAERTNRSEGAFVSCFTSSASKNHFYPFKCVWCLCLEDQGPLLARAKHTQKSYKDAWTILMIQIN